MLTTATKVALVLSGYVMAAVLAFAVLQLNTAETAPDTSSAASSGMSAFSDGLLFLLVFGVAAVPATVAAVFLLIRARAAKP